MSDALLVLGVRHHGPGSARGVVAALDGFAPDVVLVELPGDADAVLGFARDAELEPPVALLAYAADDPSLAAFWPLADFSPEWQALRWALRPGEARTAVPVRCIDLPATHQLALDAAAREGDDALDGDAGNAPDGEVDPADADRLADDPLRALLAASGHDDPDGWWEAVIERPAGGPPFAAVAEAIGAVRAELGPPLAPPAAPAEDPLARDRLLVREAAMRQAIRSARKDGFARIAVVCGAFHAPALREPLPAQAADQRLLRGLPKRKVHVTWVPWTHGRLAEATAVSPGWAAHCLREPSAPAPGWLARAAALLRARGSNASTAQVIDAVRLAEALAAMRGRPVAALSDLRDAALATLCDGDPVVAELIERDLLIDERQGSVPEGAPSVALEADLAARARVARLKREPRSATRELDLRRPLDQARSVLLHQVRVLGIGWGEPAADVRRSTGTFRETWAFAWDPALALDVVEASRWGTTVQAAATARLCHDALTAELPQLAAALGDALRADLAEAVAPLLACLDRRAAWQPDLAPVLEAIPGLVDTARYGDVRGTPLPALRDVLDALIVRACAGLPTALRGHDAAASEELSAQLDEVHAAIVLHDDPAQLERWLAALALAAGRADVHPLLLGRIARLRIDAGALTPEQAAAAFGRALSIGPDVEWRANWTAGFVAGPGLLLVHHPLLLELLDDWLAALGEEDARIAVALLRRAFGSLILAERRAIAGLVRGRTGQAAGVSVGVGMGAELDVTRATPALQRASAVLGLDPVAVVAAFAGSSEASA